MMARLPIVPASFFGIVLGLAGIGSSWRQASVLWGLPRAIGEALMALAALVWATLIVLYTLKWLLARQDAVDEVSHPIQCCFIGLVGVSTMLMAGATLPYSRVVALILFGMGAGLAILFAVWRTGGLWRGGRAPSSTTAALYLPTVAGSFVTAIVVSALGHRDWGQLAFGAGLFSWLATESVLLGRLYTAEPLATPLRPTLGIQLAPPTVGLVAYLSVTEGIPDTLATGMLGYGLLQALVLARLLPWIGGQTFAASYWGFSFGLSALATAPVLMSVRGDTGAASILAPYLFTISNILIAILALRTVLLWGRGRLLPAPGSPATGPAALR
jgi:tellurite resistance protein